MKTEQFNRCDVCGRFISFADLESGKASRSMVTPDSNYSCEEYETLCAAHAKPANPFSMHGIGKCDTAAPGVSLCSTRFNDYGTFSGTSGIGPHS